MTNIDICICSICQNLNILETVSSNCTCAAQYSPSSKLRISKITGVTYRMKAEYLILHIQYEHHSRAHHRPVTVISRLSSIYVWFYDNLLLVLLALPKTSLKSRTADSRVPQDFGAAEVVCSQKFSSHCRDWLCCEPTYLGTYGLSTTYQRGSGAHTSTMCGIQLYLRTQMLFGESADRGLLQMSKRQGCSCSTLRQLIRSSNK